MRRATCSLWAAAVVAAGGGTSVAVAAGEPVSVHAAGSLRAAMTDLGRAYEARSTVSTRFTFGPSGLLKDRIAGGEASQVFASANMTHPQALVDAGRAEPVRAFARNALCALTSPSFSLQGGSLVQRLLDPAVRVGTSTPRADPSGDYAFQMFERIESSGAAREGATALLKSKALQLTGGPTSRQPQPGRNLYGQIVAEGQADVFVTYCTNATEARQQLPSLQVLPIPDAINVSAMYGIAVVRPAAPAAQAFVEFVLGPEGQQILARHGFSAP